MKKLARRRRSRRYIWLVATVSATFIFVVRLSSLMYTTSRATAITTRNDEDAPRRQFYSSDIQVETFHELITENRVTSTERELSLCTTNPYIASLRIHNDKNNASSSSSTNSSSSSSSHEEYILAHIQSSFQAWKENYEINLFNLRQKSAGEHTHVRFDAFPQFAECAEEHTSCVGGPCREDTSKIVCGLETLQAPCTIYSIGGNNQWEFEQDVHSKTPCEVYTFDCTGPRKRFHPPTELERLHFSHICLAAHDTPKPTRKQRIKSGSYVYGEMLSLESIQRRFHNYAQTSAVDDASTSAATADTKNSPQLSLLKMDIEGYEYPVLEQWAERFRDTPSNALPMQILVEVHYQTYMTELFDNDLDRAKNVTRRSDWKDEAQLMDFSRAMMELGYAVIVRDDNALCPHCTELTLIRYKC